ncbi:VOC family protein [Streptomyces pacificus]|uniref:VOC family protein n=1 Tax=Streptomyces pacificus TaxID=2705029 RepID=A0A6A0B335_9ACTN|nr:VOC family protein [Streptomyces pacificus]GFH39095.1 VOC family protein [Streptomyces pacificus]
MADASEGTPIWADAMFPDLEGAKAFYGEVLGWTFGESSPEYGGYTRAFADGKAVAAVVPPAPGQEGPSRWCLYLASPDAAATAGRIRENGGTVLLEPTQVGELGTMCLARDPGGVFFGVWQGGTYKGFEATNVPGSFCWAEVVTREPGKADAFFPAVFGYGVKALVDPEGDFKVFDLGRGPVLGRMETTDDSPPEVPSYVQVYWTVADCDAAVAAVRRRGGRLVFGPMTTPFGRFAAVVDPQGAPFAVIDTATTEGEMPSFT